MKKLFFTLAALSMSGLFVACSNHTSSSSEQVAMEKMCPSSSALVPGIVGGQKVKPTDPLAKSLVFLIMKNGDAFSGCTGTLVSSDIVLTAAHCVDTVLNDPSHLMKVVFSTEPQCALAAGKSVTTRTVQAVSVQDNWFKSSREMGDLALVKISEKAPSDAIVLPLAQSFSELTVKDAVTIAGYGKTLQDYNAQDSAPMALRVTQVRPPNASIKEILLQELRKKDPRSTLQASDLKDTDTQESLTFDQTEGHGICAGDSGGPALLMTGNQLQIIGVASSVANPLNPDSECGFLGIHTNVVRYHSWLMQTMQNLENQ